MARTLELRMDTLEQDHSLRLLLIQTEYSSRQFAELLGIHWVTLSRMVCGRTPTPRYLILAALMIVYSTGKPIRVINPSSNLSTTAKKGEEVSAS